MFRHILPQCVAPYLILATTHLGVAIVIEASLGIVYLRGADSSGASGFPVTPKPFKGEGGSRTTLCRGQHGGACPRTAHSGARRNA